MKSFTVAKEDSGKHVVSVCRARLGASSSDLYKALKKRDIKIDGKRISSDIAVYAGANVEVWLPDGCFSQVEKKEITYKIVADESNLLIADKPQGLAVHSGAGISGTTLIDLVRKDYPSAELCHRIDMNTGGLVCLAKNREGLELFKDLYSKNLITKRYRALLVGVPEGGEPVECFDGTLMFELKAYLEKARGEVYVHDDMHPGDVEIITRYRVLKTYSKPMALADCEFELVTGRTHQIRAQMAHIGCPIAGDGKYGREAVNKNFKSLSGGRLKYQQLFSTGLMFGKIPGSPLSGRKIVIAPSWGIMGLGGDKNE